MNYFCCKDTTSGGPEWQLIEGGGTKAEIKAIIGNYTA